MRRKTDLRCQKGNDAIKVNPCDESTLRGITYKSNGIIQSSDPVIDEDLNQRLNLNGANSSFSGKQKTSAGKSDF